jgi:hypothetical protein
VVTTAAATAAGAVATEGGRGSGGRSQSKALSSLCSQAGLVHLPVCNLPALIVTLLKISRVLRQPRVQILCYS